MVQPAQIDDLRPSAQQLREVAPAHEDATPPASPVAEEPRWPAAYKAVSTRNGMPSVMFVLADGTYFGYPYAYRS